MGYTHYWKTIGLLDTDKLKACIADMAKIIHADAAILAGGDGTGKPVMDDREVVFNGREDQKGDYETFAFPGGKFCKTGGMSPIRPYDRTITACLIVARDHFPHSVLVIRSDGTWDEWKEGRALYARVFGREAKNPLSERE